ncbi:MAG: amino-acid N-acetyltransferase [Methylococcales bacterium]|nr:amino-acid N-acetyltransferase [Methylococcales bacterium]MDD5754534.1 amino-acid N-acetyltransferase [Methylococcales bacterium]
MKNNFVHWFRGSSPYIQAHRNKTFVINFGGEALQDDSFQNLIHDFALLSSLGIRLVLVHGIRPQIDARLQKLNHPARFHNQLRITDDMALQCVKEAAGLVRVEIEALLSMGLANSPMANSELNVVSGNFIVAKPIGVIDGIDYANTGAVRRINSDAIHAQLEHDNLVLISPVGYSPSGDVFNLSAEQVATAVAISLNAEKLIFLTEASCVDANGKLIAQLTTNELKQIPPSLPFKMEALKGVGSFALNAAIESCDAGIARVHLINRHIDGALLQELFTRDGVGTLISSAPYEICRAATLNDIGGILELIKPLERQGILAKRSREKIEMEIADYVVIERDGLIIGCAALHVNAIENCAVLACLAVHADYRGGARGQRLFSTALTLSKTRGVNTIFVLSTQTVQWFVERGFALCEWSNVPDYLKALYNPRRNSKILFKTLE